MEAEVEYLKRRYKRSLQDAIRTLELELEGLEDKEYDQTSSAVRHSCSDIIQCSSALGAFLDFQKRAK